MKVEYKNRINVEWVTAAKISEEELRASELTVEEMTPTTGYMTVQVG